MSKEITVTMGKREAAATIKEIGDHITQIDGHLTEMRRLAADLKTRQGYKALGFKSLEDCLKAHFSGSRAAVYRLADAGQVEQAIGEVGSEIPERQLRELTKYDPEAQKAIWDISKGTAPGGIVTADHVRSVVKVVTELVQVGGLDDGTGEAKPLGVLITANVVEETYERLQRQRQHIIDRQLRKHGPPTVSSAVTVHVAGDGRILLYADKDTVAQVQQMLKKGIKSAWLTMREPIQTHEEKI